MHEGAARRRAHPGHPAWLTPVCLGKKHLHEPTDTPIVRAKDVGVCSRDFVLVTLRVPLPLPLRVTSAYLCSPERALLARSCLRVRLQQKHVTMPRLPDASLQRHLEKPDTSARLA